MVSRRVIAGAASFGGYLFVLLLLLQQRVLDAEVVGASTSLMRSALADAGGLRQADRLDAGIFRGRNRGSQSVYGFRHPIAYPFGLEPHRLDIGLIRASRHCRRP